MNRRQERQRTRGACRDGTLLVRFLPRTARLTAAACTSAPLRRDRWTPPRRARPSARDDLRPLARRLPRSSHLLAGVLQLLAALLDVAFDLLAAPLFGEAFISGGLAGGFFHCA